MRFWMARARADRYNASMPAQRRLVQTLIALAALLSGCGQGDIFARLPDTASPEVAQAPYPTLLSASQHPGLRTPAPDPAAGAAVVAAMQVEAALLAAESARVSGPVFAVAPLRAEAAAVRAGR